MRTIYRYKAAKPVDGHFSLRLHEDAQILTFCERWKNEDQLWEIVIDVLCDSTLPVEKRTFLLCGAGDDLTFLGDAPEAFHLGSYSDKGYVSHLFDTSHMPDSERFKGKADWKKLQRAKPDLSDALSYRGRQKEAGRAG